MTLLTTRNVDLIVNFHMVSVCSFANTNYPSHLKAGLVYFSYSCEVILQDIEGGP